MPSTVTGLVLFVLFFAPGFAFLVRTESRFPSKLSAPREAGVVVTTSLLFDGLALLFFAVIRWVLPWLTPDVDAFVRSPSEYFVDHYGEVLTWGTLLLLVAMGLAWLSAVPGSTRPLTAGTVLRLAEHADRPVAAHAPPNQPSPAEPPAAEAIVSESGWSKIMDAKPGHYVVVSARLGDGRGPRAVSTP